MGLEGRTMRRERTNAHNGIADLKAHCLGKHSQFAARDVPLTIQICTRSHFSN